jgi:hypothetical protein
MPLMASSNFKPRLKKKEMFHEILNDLNFTIKIGE